MNLSTKKGIITLLVILLITVVVRFWNITVWSLDVDEAFTPEESKKIDLKSFRDYFALKNASLLEQTTANKLELTQIFLTKTYPLYYFLNHQFIKIYGVNEFSLRILSVIFGIIGVMLTFVIGKEFFSYRVGVISACFSLFHPLIHFHSQNARFYSMAYCISLLVIYVSLWVRRMLLGQEVLLKDNIKLAICGVVVWLAMLVHGSLIFSIILFLIMLLDVIFERGVTNFIRRSAYLWIPFIGIGVFVLINQIIFLKARLGTEGVNSDLLEIGGSNCVYNFLSMIFNFGFYFWMIIPLGIWVFIKDRNRIFGIILFSFLLSLCLYLFLSLKSWQVRFDYFYSVLPLFLIMVTFTIVRAVDLYAKENLLVKTISAYVLALFLAGLMLPSSISNLLIDGDRLNWKEAMVYIQDYRLKNRINEAADIYSPAPDSLKFYLKNAKEKIEPQRLREMDINSIGRKYKDIFIVVPLTRSGFDLRNIPEGIRRFIFENGVLLKVIGKDRLDVHICKLAVFKIR